MYIGFWDQTWSHHLVGVKEAPEDHQDLEPEPEQLLHSKVMG